MQIIFKLIVIKLELSDFVQRSDSDYTRVVSSLKTKEIECRHLIVLISIHYGQISRKLSRLGGIACFFVVILHKKYLQRSNERKYSK